jgi:hypothetical protein
MGGTPSWRRASPGPARVFVPGSSREFISQPSAANFDLAPMGYRPRGQAACNPAPSADATCCTAPATARSRSVPLIEPGFCTRSTERVYVTDRTSFPHGSIVSIRTIHGNSCPQSFFQFQSLRTFRSGPTIAFRSLGTTAREGPRSAHGCRPSNITEVKEESSQGAPQ